MDVARTQRELAELLDGARGRVALVPTMGNLHRGHIALVAAAQRDADFVAASIFVNPLQFGPAEDYKTYPRTFDDDCAALAAAGVDAVFAPSVQDIFPEGQESVTPVRVPAALATVLEGAARPGHFDGVATVVARLFQLVRPAVAVFGEKDFQQLLVVRWLVRELGLPVEIVGEPTVRDPDGVALSSRNQYLTPDERARAPAIFTALTAVAGAVRAGEHDWAKLSERARTSLAHAGLVPDYVEVRNADDLSAPVPGAPLVALAAARIGRARLIDNVRV